MNRSKIGMLSCALIILLTTLLVTAKMAEAASLTCGAWSVVSSPNPAGSAGSVLNGVAAVSTSDVWAVGSFIPPSRGDNTLTEHWNGTNWSVVPSPNPGSFYNVLYGVAAVSANDVWAVGYCLCINGTNLALIEHWDGTSWSVVPSSNPGSSQNILNGVAVVSANNIWAVGYSCCSSNNSIQTLIEHWNGTNWNVVPSPNPGSPGSLNDILNGVAVVSANNIWAVGYSCCPGNVSPLIEHWNGTKWKVIPSPSPNGTGSFLNGVATVSMNNVWAVGYFNPTSREEQTLTEQWNGKQWSIVSSPNVGMFDRLTGVAVVSATDIWTVGQYRSASNSAQTLIEQWNGTQWSIVSNSGLSSYLSYFTGVARVLRTGQLWTVGSYNTTKGSTRLTLTEFYC